MESKKVSKKADYSKIKRKLYSFISIAVIAAVVFVAFLRWIILQQGGVGDWAVNFLRRSFRLEHQDAMRIYHFAIRENLEIILFSAMAVCFFFLLHFIISNFMRYFDEVNAAIDSLIQNESKEIAMSAPMDFMEHKLGTLKHTLEKREHDAKLAEERKNDLVMYLAHDIKTPLTSVIGYLSLLDEAKDMPNEQKARYVRIALDKSCRLEQLVDGFFEITRYNLRAMTLSKKTIDLYYMLVQMADEFYPQLCHSGKRVQIHAPEDLSVYGDPDKLARVFNNILRNAVAYSEDKSVIDITGEVAGDSVLIVLRNKGAIPEDKLASIFEKFYRLDETRSSDNEGAGLGLAIAKEIITLHGGQIYAQSDGRHTSFTVELPVIPMQP